MTHVTYQMTKLILEHKVACKSRLVLDLSQAKRIECAMRAVIKLYCTSVSCEWVSCLHTPSNFWNSFQDTEITTIYQMMWNTMSSNSFANVSLATAMLKMKTLPTEVSPWLSVVPPSSFSIDMVIEVVSSSELLIFSLTLLMFWTYRSQRLLRFCQARVLHFKTLLQCDAKFWSLSKRLLRTISIQTKNPMFVVLQPFSFRS